MTLEQLRQWAGALPQTLPSAPGEYNAQAYIGGPPDGVRSNTAALDRLYADYKSNGYAGRIYFPPSQHPYVYDGNGWDGTHYNVAGSGRSTSVIRLAPGSYLMRPSGGVLDGEVHEIQFLGGAGAFKQSYTGNSGFWGIDFRNVGFKDYSTCAVGSLSYNSPFVQFTNCYFDGTSSSSIGIAIRGDNSSCFLSGCQFRRNRYHIKIGNAGIAFRVTNCDFFRYDAYAGTPRTDIWLVPNPVTATGYGFYVGGGTKFGNENIDTHDYKILCADEGPIATDFTDTYHSELTSSLKIRGLMIQGVHSQGNLNHSPPFVYSTVDDLDECLIGPNLFHGTPPPYLVQFLNPAAKSSSLMSYTGNVCGVGLVPFSNRTTSSL